MLKLSLLGAFQAVIQDTQLTRFRSDKVRALLAYLAVEAGQPHRREAVAALLWSDVPDSAARKNLRGSLYRLKTAVSQADATLSEGLINSSNRSVQVEERLIWVDVQAFQDNIAACEAHDHQELARCKDCLERLETAVSLYKGELLLGFHLEEADLFNEWLLLKREQLHQQMQLALDLLIESYSQRGDYQQVRIACQQQLGLEPWHEKAYRQLMLALAQDGQRSAALAQFEKCQQVLWDELGVEPSSETIAVYERIREGEEGGVAKTAVFPSAPQHNLPARMAPYFGRQEEQAQLKTILAERNSRLVTLVGEGGVGKTSLAIEVGRTLLNAFPDGVWLVSLARLAMHPPNTAVDEQLEAEIMTAVAQTLGLETSGQISLRDQLFAYLRQHRLLLILDNFEHIISGANVVGEMLQHAPQLSILATSREPLNFVAEYVYALGGLPISFTGQDSEANTVASPIVQLFVDRAQRVAKQFALDNASLEQVVILCRLVNGNPLAVELAAASLRKRPLATLVSQISKSLDILTSRQRDLPQRHRSMRAVLMDSWAMLQPDEQQILAKLSLFQGGFSADAAYQIAKATPFSLETLSEKSLVQVVDLANGRYQLHELLRQFSTEQLEEDTKIQRTYSHYYLQFVSERADDLQRLNPQIPAAEIALDLDNIRKGWQMAVMQVDDEKLLPAIYPLATFFQLQGRYAELVRLYSTTIQSFEEEPSPTPEMATVLARLLAEQARASIRLGLYDAVRPLINNGLRWAAKASDPVVAGRLNLFLGELLWRQGEDEEAKAILEGVLETAVDHQDQELKGYTLFNLGIVHDIQAQAAEAKQFFEQSLSLWKEVGNRRLEAYTYNSIGLIAFNNFDNDTAKYSYQNALKLNTKIGDVQGKSLVLNNLSVLAIDEQEFAQAKRYLAETLTLARRSGNKLTEAIVYSNLGLVAHYEEAFQVAQPYLEISIRIYKQLGNLRGQAFVEKQLNDLIEKVKES